MYERLRAQRDLLAKAYVQNIAGTVRIQTTLIEDILPGVVDELNLDSADEERAGLWLKDVGTSQQYSRRRHKFTVPFALEHARDTLLWRLAAVPPTIPHRPASFLRCLPHECRDPFHRPIIVVKLAQLFEASEDVRGTLTHNMELLRLNLKALNENSDAGDSGSSIPVLQYVALLDIGGVSVQHANADLISWFVFELIPRFPGMFAAVFILNYSWAHSGVWNVVKRVLPESALSRVFFPSGEELLQYIPPSVLPQEYGGSLPPLSSLEDPFANLTEPPSGSPHPTSSAVPVPHQSALRAEPQPIPRVGSIPATSHLNPYFGYPVSGRDALTPRLRYGRQRKRDLLRTLASLWWSRWRRRVYVLLCIVVAFMMVSLRRRPRILRWKETLRGILISSPGPR
ncbi:CRAL-TRIO domain-containing protein [Trametes punicea]|nr:CRAL-TRIO domain-containing protein [Trametes punicea]